MACLQARRRTIFAEEEWKTIPWSGSRGQKPDIEYLVDIFADLPGALFERSDIVSPANGETEYSPRQHMMVNDAKVYLIIQRLQQWKSTRLQQSDKHHFDDAGMSPTHFDSDQLQLRDFSIPSIDYARSCAVYTAVCTITLNLAFSDTLRTLHGEQCTRQDTSLPKDSTALYHRAYQFLGLDILQWHHSLLTDACSLAHYYWSCKGTTPQPTEILIPLRQVWKATRHLNCTIAMNLRRIMEDMMDDSEAPFMYTS